MSKKIPKNGLSDKTLLLAKKVGILTLSEYESKMTGSSAIWCTYSKDAASGMWYANTWEDAYEKANAAVEAKSSRKKKS